MKSLIALLTLASMNTFAVDICKFEETWEFVEALEAKGIKPFKISNDHDHFSKTELELIHRTVTLPKYLSHLTAAEALEEFGDYYEGERGSDAGEIQYYHINGETHVLVHYWPGENEGGAYFIQKNGKYILKAEIGDSFIGCKKGKL